MIERLKCRVRLKPGGKKRDDRAKPAAPSLDFAQPQPMAVQPSLDDAGADGGEAHDAGPTARKADPNKVADRVYELMRKEIADSRTRGGAGRKR